VTDVSGIPKSTVQESTVQNNPTANASRNHQGYEVGHIRCCPKSAFSKGKSFCVIIYNDR